MTNYQIEQAAFFRLKENSTPKAKKEYETAIATLVADYNTTIHENRFVVGGAVEIFTYALLRKAGIDCTLVGDQSPSGDIRLTEGGKLISLKSSFTGGATPIILVNQMGQGTRPWETATLFVLSNIGIVFGTPSMVVNDTVKFTGDGTTLTKKGLESFIADPMNVMRMNIPIKPHKDRVKFSKKASTAVAKQILSDMDSKILLPTLNKQ